MARAKKTAEPRAKKTAPARKKKGQAEAGSVGLGASEVLALEPPQEVCKLAEKVEADGGALLGTYRDPFGSRWTMLVSLPIDKVEPTPYQRELSEAHVARLATVIPKVGQFLDPLVVTRHDSGYWTPNGMHRLMAMRRIGAKAIIALLVPDPDIAYRILALNTEKAHNLKDKSLEVIRMAKGLAAIADTGDMPESTWAFEFEEPAYLTIGMCYEERPRFSGGAYLSVLKRCDEFADKPIAKSLEARVATRDKVLALDDAVAEAVVALKERGMQSAYLKPFVVARINPLRWQKPAKVGEKSPRAEMNATLDKMIAAAKAFDVDRVKPQDLASMAGAPVDEG